ncbi:MAG: selenide, water dikinase SelD [Qingshengfaniella sp.]
MHSPLPLTRDLVLIGGGHSHALVLRRWAMRPLPGARLTLIDPSPFATYSGMLPGFVAGHYERAALNIDLMRLAQAAGARFVCGTAEGIDHVENTVAVAGRPGLRYDVLSIDIGVTSAMPDLPGFAAHAVPVKPLGPFATRWAAFAEAALNGAAPAEVTVIGAGVAGAELSLAMAHRLRTAQPTLRLIEAGQAFRDLAPRAAALLRRRVAGAGIQVIEQAPVAEIGPGWTRLADGRRFAHGLCCGTAGARAHGWLADTGLALENGHLRVDRALRTSDPAIFAAGDCAHMAHSPRPKAGVFAVRQAPILGHNLRATLSGGKTRAYRPQRHYLKLISLGAQAAIADRPPLALAAPWLWRLKDRIDRRFMAMLSDLPAMAAPSLPREHAAGLAEELGPAPFCGGCGSKVGPGGLGTVLAGMSPTARPDILSRPGDDAAVLAIGGQQQVLTTDHLRAVVEDPWIMGQIAAIHALGDIWAMGATPQAALASVILPRMRRSLQTATLAEITLAAEAVFRAAGAELVGGHSTMGAEMTLGFTITGLVPAAPVTIAGAHPGDVLILTRPIGSGVLLAAEMRGQAPGDLVLRLLARMTRPQGTAAAILAPAAHAMTDVTGFGLAGHLLNIARASGLTIRLDPDAVPLDAGALDLAGRGVRSSLYRDNRDACWPAMTGFAEDPLSDLLLDPQTCGGLLAAVPAARADDLIAALHDAGEAEARIIGAATTGPPDLCRA